MTIRPILASLALILGALAALVGRPVRSREARVDVAALASAVAREQDHVTALELGEWIRDGKANLQVLDLRSEEEFAEYHIPTAQRVALEELPARHFDSSTVIVLYSEGGAHAAQAWVFLRALGVREVYFLRGGLLEWLDDLMNVTRAVDASPAERQSFERAAALSRYFGGTPAVGPRAASGAADRPSAAPRPRRRGC